MWVAAPPLAGGGAARFVMWVVAQADCRRVVLGEVQVLAEHSHQLRGPGVLWIGGCIWCWWPIGRADVELMRQGRLWAMLGATAE